MSAKLNEALSHMKLAEKALKTSMFKWSPDYDTAASEYTKAATNFKLGGSPSQSKEAYVKAAEVQEKLGALFHSAKLLTQAAGISSDLNDMEEAVRLMEKACFLYREHGSPDTAASTISKAAKMCEAKLPDRSVEMYLKAADLCEDDEKLRDASNYLNRASCLQIKQKNFVQSCEIMKRRLEIIRNIGNLQVAYPVILQLVITYLAEEDCVAADNAYKLGFDLNGFGGCDEAMYCEHFIKAFEEGDEELLKKTQCQTIVTHLDTEYARLAKTLKLSELNIGSGTTTSFETVVPSSKPTPVAQVSVPTAAPPTKEPVPVVELPALDPSASASEPEPTSASKHEPTSEPEPTSVPEQPAVPGSNQVEEEEDEWDELT